MQKVCAGTKKQQQIFAMQLENIFMDLPKHELFMHHSTFFFRLKKT